MTIEEFLNNASIEALLLAFVNAKPSQGSFLIESSYRATQYNSQNLTIEVYQANNRLMSDYFGLDFQLAGKKHQFFITTSLSNTEFFRKIYQKIVLKRLEENIDTYRFEQKMLLAFFVPRGSFDFKAKFFTIDLLSSVITSEYLDLLFKLLTNINDLRQFNLNFRELQKDYREGKKRNTQFRINLRYFYDIAGDEVAKINRYKSSTIKENQSIIESFSINHKINNSFIERLLFYKQNVLGQAKDNNEIEQLRRELGFDEGEDKAKRNQSIVNYARVMLPDECVGCCDDYSLSERTFKYRDSERYYLEIHHCISFSSGQSFDQIDNLVKLCPSCHRALTKHRADEQYQKHIITSILSHSPQVTDFCLNFTSHSELVEFVYKRLA